jgi:putative addiction module component (TIGR02574 family)
MATLQQQILRLDRDERLRLVQYIIDSLRFEEFALKVDAELTAEQEAELERRSEQVRLGKATYHSWDSIKAGLISS